MSVNNSFLIKFFEEPGHVNEYRRGKIRLMSCYHYATLEQSTKLCNNRDDSTEGATYLINRDYVNKSDTYNLGNSKVTLGEGVKTMCFNSAKLNQQLKISCYYALMSSDMPDDKINTALSTMKHSLGEYYCVITDTRVFTSRIQRKLNELLNNGTIIKSEADLVKYYDARTFTGLTAPFNKPDCLSWQKEYRILVQTVNEKDPFYIDIGDISDITICGTKKDLEQGYANGNELTIPNFKRDFFLSF